MSDCTRGGRIAYEKPCGQRSFSSSKETGEENGALMLRIDFKGSNESWTYPLAANGRKLSGLSVDGARWVPLDFDFQEIFEDGKRVAIELEGERYEREAAGLKEEIDRLRADRKAARDSRDRWQGRANDMAVRCSKLESLARDMGALLAAADWASCELDGAAHNAICRAESLGIEVR